MNRRRTSNQSATLDRIAPDNAAQFLRPYRSYIFTRVGRVWRKST